MDMRLDRALVRRERQKRAWSQEHLAEVTGLGLRTIQRVEKTGSASYESVRALASVFSLEIENLTILEVKRKDPGLPRGITALLPNRVLAGIAATAILTFTALFVSGPSWADQVMLDIGISHSDEEMTIGHLLIADGKAAEMRINDVVRVVVTPTIQNDGKVFLSAKIYENVDGEFVLLFEPKLITADGKEAEIRVDADSGTTFRIVITPHTD